MNIKQTASHLTRTNQPFDVLITEPNGNEREYKLKPPFTQPIEDTLKEIIDDWKPIKMIIQERKINGNSTIKTGTVNVTLNGIEETPIKPQPNTMIPQQAIPGGFPQEYKDYIITDLKEKNKELKTKLEKFETENEKLKTDNFELMKDAKFKDKEFELARAKDEAERSSGLSGVFETVATNPQLSMLAGTLLSRVMGMEAPPMAAPPQEAPLSGAEKEGTETTRKIAEYVGNWIRKQDDETATKFFQLTMEITKDKTLIADILEDLNDEEYAQAA